MRIVFLQPLLEVKEHGKDGLASSLVIVIAHKLALLRRNLLLFIRLHGLVKMLRRAK